MKVNLYSGARTPLPPGAEALLNLRDGHQQTVALPNSGFVSEPSTVIDGLPFFDNFGDSYAVVASANGYQQAGFYPVTVNPASPAVVDIMLLKNDATFNFPERELGSAQPATPCLHRVIGRGSHGQRRCRGSLLAN